jgi:NAD(P)H dehydrogenase (quinone)
MNVLIVYAHPEPQSFNGALLKTGVDTLTKLGHQVQVSDLYAMNFNPVGSRADFTTVADADYFKYQAEQLYAYKNNGYAADILAEQQKMEWADVVIFQFPMWWFSMPAILKGWMDRVLAMGFAYGGGRGSYKTGVFKGKKSMLVFTTGEPEMAYGEGARNGDLNTLLYPIHHGILYYVGMDVLPPFVVWSPQLLTEEERANYLAMYAHKLKFLVKTPALTF